MGCYFFLFLCRTIFLVDACHVCLTPLSELMQNKMAFFLFLLLLNITAVMKRNIKAVKLPCYICNDECHCGMGHRYFKLVRPLPFTMISYFYFLFLITKKKKKGEEEEKGFLIIVKVLAMYSAPPGCGSIPCRFFFRECCSQKIKIKISSILLRFFFLE